MLPLLMFTQHVHKIKFGYTHVQEHNVIHDMTGSIIHCRVVMNTLLASYSAHTQREQLSIIYYVRLNN